MEAAIDQSISDRSENLYLLLIFNNDEAIDRETSIHNFSPSDRAQVVYWSRFDRILGTL